MIKKIYLDNFLFVGPFLKSFRESGVCETLLKEKKETNPRVYTTTSIDTKNFDGILFFGDEKKILNQHFQFFISTYSIYELLLVFTKESNKEIHVHRLKEALFAYLEIFLPNINFITINDKSKLECKASFLKSEKDHEDTIHLKIASDLDMWFIADNKFYKKYKDDVEKFYSKMMNVDILNKEFESLGLKVRYDHYRQIFYRKK